MRKILLLLPFFLWTCGGGGGSTEPEPPQLPTVTNIEVTTLEDTAKTFALTGTDPNNLALTYSISTQPQHGTISISGGAATYSPNANYNGQDVIAFLASSTNGNSNIGTIIITITPVDDEPNTLDITVTTDEDNSVSMILEAEEYDGENIEFQVRNNPSNGSVTISGTTATYIPNQDWYGTDQFNFEAVDSNNRSIINVATGTITVNSINDAPIANNMSVSTNENRIKQLEITLEANDVDGDNLTFSIVGDVSDGTTSINNNIVSYTPSQDWNGTDTFTYKANDGNVDSNVATVTITVNAVNDAPTTSDISISTNEDNAVSITLVGTDIENDNLAFFIEQQPSSGTVTIDGNSALYTPSQDWNGTDTFTYKANDGTNNSNTSTVSIAVIAINDAPIITDINLEVLTRTSVDITLSGSDAENDNLTYSIVQQPSSGSITIQDNIVTYTSATFAGQDNFTFLANDGTLDSNNASVNITINWNNITFGVDAYNLGYSIQETSDGGIILAGRTNLDAYLVKTDESGNKAWENTYGGAQSDIIYSAKETLDGGFILAGSSMSFGNGQNDMYLVKTDESGNKEWENTYSTSGNWTDVAYSIDITSDGGYILAGSYNKTGDIYLVKTDASGNKEWDKTYGEGGASQEVAFSVKPTLDDGFILAGLTTAFSGSDDIYLVKTNSEGNKEWSKHFSTPLDEDAHSIELTSDGGYIIFGKTKNHGSISFDFYLLKIDSLGNKEWEQIFGGSGDEVGKSVKKTTDGGFILAGFTNSFGSGNFDFYLVKTDASGNKEWEQTFGGLNDDYGWSVDETSDGGFVIGGVESSFNTSAVQMFMVKTDSQGNRIF